MRKKIGHIGPGIVRQLVSLSLTYKISTVGPREAKKCIKN